MFPEGRISNDKKLLPFTPSYILIALRSGAPIIPVVTDGNYGLFKRVHILIGKKIYLSDYCKSTNPTKEELEKINKIISRKIALLKNTLQEKIDQDKCKFGLLSKLAWDFGRLLAFTFNFGFKIIKICKIDSKVVIIPIINGKIRPVVVNSNIPNIEIIARIPKQEAR